jgi:membrane protein implicated in regulation of membrane protease activity
MAVRDRIERLGATAAVAILLLAVMIAAAVFVMYGAALAVASYSGDRLWLGYLLTGLFFMLAITAILFTGRRRARAQARRILEQKYARYDRNSQTDAGERTDTPA